MRIHAAAEICRIFQFVQDCFDARFVLLYASMKPFGYLSTLVVSASLAGSMFAQPTQIAIDRDSGSARITLDGEAGFDYRLEAVPAFSPTGEWDFLGTLALDGNPQSWMDSRSALLPQRFYRAVKLSPAPPEAAPDFRLIDHMAVPSGCSVSLGTRVSARWS